ncbi:MAG: hypothetical protein BWY47_01906 [Bacteroidetes bacterium ADurb.Bin302]|jgi:hypothetical protein|nr:MAG: hypothetical protein BWY47_01906 [Bacteroidetes bacterium ADurb.Bin302]
MGLKIRKTVINSRSEEQARAVERILTMSKKIVGVANRKEEEKLFNTYMTERQSMKKAHAFNAWKDFVLNTVK